jgi:hypothetical protein
MTNQDNRKRTPNCGQVTLRQPCWRQNRQTTDFNGKYCPHPYSQHGNSPLKTTIYADKNQKVRHNARLLIHLRHQPLSFSMTTQPAAAKPITSYRKYWASRFGTAPFLPMSRAEMDQLGWDSCDIILISGDCYIDHPSFGMALVGRLLEAQGFRGHHRAAGLAVGRTLPRAGQAEPVFRRHRRQYGFDDQPLHGGPSSALG